MQSREDWSARAATVSLSQSRTGACVAQFAFDPMEMRDLTEDPPDEFRCVLLGFEKLAAYVCHATSQPNALATLASKAIVSFIAIGLDDPVKVNRYDFLQATGSTTGLPMEHRVASRIAARPKVTLPRLAVTRSEIADRRLIDLHITAGEDLLSHLLVDRPQPIRSKTDPLRHRLSRQPDAVARPVDGFLTVERKMIAIFANEDLREKPRTSDAPLEDGLRQWCHDRHRVDLATMHVLRSHRSAPEELRRLVIEPLTDLFPDAPP